MEVAQANVEAERPQAELDARFFRGLGDPTQVRTHHAIESPTTSWEVTTMPITFQRTGAAPAHDHIQDQTRLRVNSHPHRRAVEEAMAP